ncbi:hypothetical protein B0H13DRAFT_1875355 [Mycena leptocephala]|nr:hypothetical protein B0H13DRAFT_1875355 [Mycena leptocephala]
MNSAFAASFGLESRLPGGKKVKRPAEVRNFTIGSIQLMKIRGGVYNRPLREEGGRDDDVKEIESRAVFRRERNNLLSPLESWIVLALGLIYRKQRERKHNDWSLHASRLEFRVLRDFVEDYVEQRRMALVALLVTGCPGRQTTRQSGRSASFREIRNSLLGSRY